LEAFESCSLFQHESFAFRVYFNLKFHPLE
jgi:hypothetical protein